MIESPKDFAARIYGLMATANGGSGSAGNGGSGSAGSASGSSGGAAQEVDAEVV